MGVVIKNFAKYERLAAVKLCQPQVFSDGAHTSLPRQWWKFALQRDLPAFNQLANFNKAQGGITWLLKYHRLDQELIQPVLQSGEPGTPTSALV